MLRQMTSLLGSDAIVMNQKHILTLNAGSSSLKFAAFDAESLSAILCGQISGMGTAPRLQVDGHVRILPPDTGFAAGLDLLLTLLTDHGLQTSSLAGIGHRIVHGGTRYVQPTLIDDLTLADLEKLRSLAPLHLPFGLSVLRIMRRLLPSLPQIACFDTAFHATQPELATRLPLPRVYFDKGYRRYGFHGLNYEHVVDHLRRNGLPPRLIAAHLGSGASMCAIVDGKSVATTMGFSTADGLVMGTRTGSIDPGVLVALLRDEKLTLEQLEDLLYRKSGLLGLSGVSSDMKVLLASDKAEAREAIDYYCYSAARHAASLVTAMNGVDGIVFTGGVGENADVVRDKIMGHLSWLNIAPKAIQVVPANEELTIARHVKSLL
jgi:acetate kinase